MKFISASERTPNNDETYHVRIDGIRRMGNFFDGFAPGEKAFYVHGNGASDGWIIYEEKFAGLEWLDESTPVFPELPKNSLILTAFQNEPVNFLLSNALRHLTQDQQRELCNALLERLPVPASITDEAERLYPDEKDERPIRSIDDIREAQRSAHTTCGRQYMGEIEKLRAERDMAITDAHTLAKMQSEAMGWVVGLKKRLQSEKPELYYLGELMNFFMGELWQYTTNLEGVHIGSNDRTKDDIMMWVFKETKEVMEFLNYAGWCNSFYNEGKTWQEFVDWQLDELNNEKAEPRRKEFIRKFIAKFNIVLNK